MRHFDRSVLFEMLTYGRPSGTPCEHAFIDRFIAPLPGVERDRYSNWHVTIGDSPILWSCHTDTVHHRSERQTWHYDPITSLVGLSRKSKRRGACLGADDTAGVALCHQMILAGVPGHYVFHHAEEIGGLGSSDIADLEPDLVSSSLFAIALDRAGYEDVITRQAGGRCASDAFALSLAAQLGGEYAPCPRGTFTDTANYTGIIPECTNLSVGYAHAHSKHETLDVDFVSHLFLALCQIDADALVCERDPSEREMNCWSLPWTFHGTPASTSIDTSAIDGTRTLFDGTLMADCEYCGLSYDTSLSDADMFEAYCSLDCEATDARLIAKRLDKVYLDPAYQDVQDALRRRTK
jgi:hypothetical protein